MTNQEIEIQFTKLVRDERRITNEILRAINLVEDRKIFLARGYPSLFAWLVKAHGYSESAAYRRIQAARVLREVPEISAKIETGAVNLSTLSKAQTAIRAEEKRTRKKISKAEVVSLIEGKTSVEADKALLSLFPESASRKSLDLPDETMADLERIRDLLSHSHPGAHIVQVIAYIAKEYLKKHDPLKSTSASVLSRVKRRDQARCQYRDTLTGRVCGSTYQLEVDHIFPRALGGGDEERNLRCLCRRHNAYMAERILGKQVANHWRRL